jgi:acetyl-CoA carboxylase biotin carboxyl carrier protein
VKKSDSKKPGKAAPLKKGPAPAPSPKAKAAAKKTEKPAAKSSAKTATRIDDVLVRELATVLNETGLTEIEYDAKGVRVRVACNIGGPMMRAAQAYAPSPTGETAAPAPAKPVDAASNPGTVKSPMVGVFYLLPEPGAAPFIKVGDQVSDGQTLALIEAMKTFNPVKAMRSGKVTKILIESGSPVEYGEPLLILE